MKVAVSVEEVLGNGAISPRLYLAYKILEIGLEVRRLGVCFRVGCNLDGEVIPGFLANEFDQLVGVAQFT